MVRKPRYQDDSQDSTTENVDKTYLNCTVDEVVRYSVLSSVVPFFVVSAMHISYAVSYPREYNSNSTAVLLIILNVMCIIPFFS